MKPLKPFKIGHGVVLSSGVRVLPGVEIGDGAVVGAASLVTRSVEPGAIVVGTPAKLLRKRPDFAPWWNFTFDYLMELGDDVQDAAKSSGPHRWRGGQPRFVLRHTGSNYRIEGFNRSGETIEPLSNAHERVLAYVSQAISPGRSYVMPDCWAQ